MTRIQVTHVYETDIDLDRLDEYVSATFDEDALVQIRDLESGEEVYDRL